MEIDCLFTTNFGSDAEITCYPSSVKIYVPKTRICIKKSVFRRLKPEKVVEIAFLQQTLEYFPRLNVTAFINLRTLVIEKCQMKVISKEDLSGLENLQTLDFSDNYLTVLPDNLLDGMRKLCGVSFRNNKLENIGVKLLEHVKNNLETADFSKNPVINEILNKTNPLSVEKFAKAMEYIKIINIDRQIIESFKETFKNIRESTKYSDFTIKVHGKEYKVHKCILAAQSSVLDGMFSNDSEVEKITFKEIKHFSEEAFKDFLEYFYDKRALNDKNAMQLYELSLVFKVLNLELDSKRTIHESLTQFNAVKLFDFGHLHSLQVIKKSSFEMIRKNHAEISDYLYENPEVLHALLKAKEEFKK